MNGRGTLYSGHFFERYLRNTMMESDQLAALLNEKYETFHTSAFVDDDPICIPHLFSKKQDIEIAGFFAATFAWGQRVTIINKCRELLERMDMAPFDFVQQHQPQDLKPFETFKHRTFQFTDLRYFLERLQMHYSKHPSLESLFSEGSTAKERLTHFEEDFTSLPSFEKRTGKHIATPARKSTCKRLNMYLRWMVRKDPMGVDLGIWDHMSSADLQCPLDVHVERVGRSLGLITRKQRDWETVEELTAALRKFDPQDPVKYDYALFGLGIMEKF